MEEAQKFANQQEMLYFETSAMSGVGVNQMFSSIGN